MSYVTNEQILEIIQKFAVIDPDGSVWGKDTQLYEYWQDAIKDVEAILCQK